MQKRFWQHSAVAMATAVIVATASAGVAAVRSEPPRPSIGGVVERAPHPLRRDLAAGSRDVLTQVAPVVASKHVNPGTSVERSLCLTVAVGAGAAYECADLRLVHGLPVTRTLNRARAPVLIYNSQHAWPTPAVYADVTLPSGATVPDSVTAVLLRGGTRLARGRWTGSQWSAGSTRRVGLSFAAGSPELTGYLPGGATLYNYTLEVSNHYAGGVVRSSSVSDTLVVVHRTGSAFHPGWWMAGLETLYFPSDTTTRLWVGGDGSTRIYRKVADRIYVAPSLTRPDTLVFSGPNYERKLPGGARVVFGSTGGHIQTKNQLGHITSFGYNDGRLVRITLPVAGGTAPVYTFSYGADGKLSTVSAPPVDGQARTTSLSYDGTRRELAITDPDGRGVKYAYGSGSWVMVRRTDRLGTPVTFSYSSARLIGARLHMTGTTGNDTSDIVQGFTPAELRGLNGRVALDTSSVYTKLDGPRTELGDTTLLWHDRWGAPRKIRDALGNETRLFRENISYPALVTRSVAPNGLVSLARHNSRGNVDSVTVVSPLGDGRNATTRYAYESASCPDFPTRITSPEDEIVRMGYESFCNRDWQEDGRGSGSRVDFQYYPSGMLAAVDGPLTLPDSVYYDALLGNLYQTKSPTGARTTSETDAIGRVRVVTSSIDAQRSQRQETWYDLMDRDTLTIAYGDTTEGNLEVKKSYDAGSNVRSVSRRSNPDRNRIGWTTTSWRYDRAGRGVAELAPGSGTYTVTLTRMVCEGTTKSSCYPESYDSTYTVEYKDSTTYDHAGNAIAVHTRRGHTTGMEYDALNRLRRRVAPAVTYEPYTEPNLNWHYPLYAATSSGALEILNQSGGVSLTIPMSIDSFTYDAMGRLRSANNPDAKVSRDYYPGGGIRSETQKIRTYAGSDTLQHVYTLNYGYDLGGRRLWVQHPSNLAPAYASDERPTPEGRRTWYAYNDATGGLETVTDVLGNQFRFFYDLEGRQDSLSVPGGIGTRWTYDTAGRLTRRRQQAASAVVKQPDGTLGTLMHNDVFTYDLRGKTTYVDTRGGWASNKYTTLGHLSRSEGRDTAGLENRYHMLETYVQDALANQVRMRRDWSNSPCRKWTPRATGTPARVVV